MELFSYSSGGRHFRTSGTTNADPWGFDTISFYDGHVITESMEVIVERDHYNYYYYEFPSCRLRRKPTVRMPHSCRVAPSVRPNGGPIPDGSRSAPRLEQPEPPPGRHFRSGGGPASDPWGFENIGFADGHAQSASMETIVEMARPHTRFFAYPFDRTKIGNGVPRRRPRDAEFWAYPGW